MLPGSGQKVCCCGGGFKLIESMVILGFKLCFLFSNICLLPVNGKWNGYCLDSQGRDQNTGVIQVSGWYATAEDCLKACWSKKDGATGCEYHTSGSGACYVHTKDVASGSGSKGYNCYVLAKKSIFISFNL